MQSVIIEAANRQEAKKKCQRIKGWTPAALREVESGTRGVKAFLCFESSADAKTWDRQK